MAAAAAAGGDLDHRLSTGRRRSRGAWGQEAQHDTGRMPPPHAPAPLMAHGQTPDPASPFVMTQVDVGLFNAVLSNWTLQDCRDCRMVLAAPGLYAIQQKNQNMQDGRRLVIEASVDGVTIQPLTHLEILHATLVLRRLTVDGNNQVFSQSGCLSINGGTVEAYNTTFRHHSGLNCAGVACVSGPGASFLASGCTFEQNNCLEVLGAGAVTLNGSGPDEPAPWVALDRCSFYENSCNGGGGAVKAYGRGVLSITNSVFTGQQARGFGGAVYASCEYNTDPVNRDSNNGALPFSAADLAVTIQGCKFQRNQAVKREYIWGGGAIYSHANLTLSNSLFYDNEVPPQIGQLEKDIAIGGGAVWNDGILRGSDLLFEKNKAARMGGAVLLGRGSAILRRCTFLNNKAGNQGGALFVNASSPSGSQPQAPTAEATSLPGAFVQNCAFQENSVTGFPAPYYTFSYPFGGGALAVWGRLLVHNSSFLDNIPPPRGELNGTVAHVDAHGMLQLAFCSFAVSAGHQRHGLRPGDLHLATPNASARCLGTHVGTAAAGASGPQCFIGPAGGEPWAAPELVLLLGLPLCLVLYIMALVARASQQAARVHRGEQEWWEHESLMTGGSTRVGEQDEEAEEMGAESDSDGSDGREEERTKVQEEEVRVGTRGYDPAATFPIPPSGIRAMWRFLRGRRRRRKPPRASSSIPSSSSSSSPKHLQHLQLDEEGRPPRLQQEGSASSESTLSSRGQEPSSSPTQDEGESGASTDKEQDGGSGSMGSGSNEREEDEGSSGEEDDEEEEVAVLEWHKTRAYRLSLGAELRDPTTPGELSANHLEPFTLEGRGRNMFQVTDLQPLTHSRFGRLYFARNTGDAGAGGGGSGAPCLMLIYNRFKHEAATLVTEKELLHTGSSSTCPFLLRHLDDFFHERVGYYVALTPCCRETLYQRLARAIQAPRDPAHALDFPTCVRYMHEILQGLGALRDLRMVHGRLSLHAVLLTEDDHVRLWNYGVPSSAAVRRPDTPTVYSAPEAWDMLRMNPAPVSSMDSWSAGVVGYMLAAKALAVTLPPCAARYRGETYTDYFLQYLLQRKTTKGGRRRSYYDEGLDMDTTNNEGRVVAVRQPTAAAPLEPYYFPSLPSIDPAFREEDRRDHGGAFVGVLSRLLDVNANRRLSLEMAELEVRQIVQRAVLLARNNSNRYGSGGGGGGGGGGMS